MATELPLEPTELPFEEGDWGESLFEAGWEFIDNPEPRCPCVLLLDTSSSMAGAPLTALQEGVQTFQQELLRDPLARQRVELAVVTFGSPAEVVQPFVSVDRFTPVSLQPRGQTPLGTGLLMALNLLEARKTDYRSHGIPHIRPWLVLITDGMPQGEPWEVTREATRRLKEDEAAGRVAFFAIGVAGANMPLLSRLSARPPLLLPNLRFVELFLWLSASTSHLVRSSTNGQLELPAPTWGPT